MIEARVIRQRAPRSVACERVNLAPPKPGELLIRTLGSAISPGTESLIFRGEMPADAVADETISSLSQSFNYPFAYGYSLVGRVEAVGDAVDSHWLGRNVFAFHPHQSDASVAVGDCFPLPEGMSWERGVFLPNMETALSLAMDLLPVIGERLMIFGQGVVGLLLTGVLRSFPLGELIVADPVSTRRELGVQWGADAALDPTDDAQLQSLRDRLFAGGDGLDAAVDVSGQPAALNAAIALAGFESRIVVGSWYGKRPAQINLGDHFHRRRLRLISSQVSHIGSALSARWSKSRRFALALEWLARLQPERLITHRYPPEECQQAFELAADSKSGAVQVVFDFG